MSSYNPYRTDPNLMQGFSNLTRALLGSAQDDASLASARASDARAGLYSSQARGVEIDNEREKAYNARVKAALENSPLVNFLGSSIGFDNPMIEKEVVVEGRPQHYAPVMQEVPTFDQDAYSSLIGALTFGQGGTANQTSQALMHLRDMAQSEDARQILLNELAAGGSPETIATILMGNTPGKYQQDNTAQYEIDSDLAGVMYGADKKLEGEKYTTNMELKEGGSQDRINENNFKIEELKLKQKKASEGEAREIELEIAKLDYANKVEIAKLNNETEIYKFNNKELTLVDGQTVILTKEQAEKRNIPIQTEGKYKGLYVYEMPKPFKDQIVKLGQGNTLVSKEVGELLNITPNADGEYIAEGSPYASSKSSSGSSSDSSSRSSSGRSNTLDLQRFEQTYDKTLQRYADENLPKHALGGIKRMFMQNMQKDMEEMGDNFDWIESFNDNIPLLSMGSRWIDGWGRSSDKNFYFPNYYYDLYERQIINGASRSDIENEIYSKLNYSKAQSKFLVDQIINNMK